MIGCLVVIGVVGMLVNNATSVGNQPAETPSVQRAEPNPADLASTGLTEAQLETTPVNPPGANPASSEPAQAPAVPTQPEANPTSGATPVSTSKTPAVTLPSPMVPETSTSSPVPTEAGPVGTIPTATPNAPCYQVSRIEDVTIPPGSLVGTEQTLIKTWSFQNTGSCAWSAEFTLARTSGALEVPYESIPLGAAVPPGATWQIGIAITAPPNPGYYEDAWKLFTDNNQPLRDDSGQEAVFSIAVIVAEATPTDEAEPEPIIATEVPTPIPPVPTSVPLARISGRITFDGSAAGAGIFLTLEDIYTQPITSAITLADGSFSWTDIPASNQGYSIVFSQANNEQFNLDQVASWVWVGPIPVQDGDEIQLPGIDISLLGFGQISPEPDVVVSTASISPDTPLVFEWMGYPNARDYWVDLVRGEAQVNVWQSQLVDNLSIEFDGTLSDGSHIAPDDYLWAIGVRRYLGAYPQTVYSFLTSLRVEE